MKKDITFWKTNIFSTLVDIESRNWSNASINFSKYFDEGGRDWYQDIEIIYDENEIDDYYDEDDEEYTYGAKIIKQHIHPYWDIYLQKMNELFEDEDVF